MLYLINVARIVFGLLSILTGIITFLGTLFFFFMAIENYDNRRKRTTLLILSIAALICFGLIASVYVTYGMPNNWFVLGDR